MGRRHPTARLLYIYIDVCVGSHLGYATPRQADTATGKPLVSVREERRSIGLPQGTSTLGMVIIKPAVTLACERAGLSVSSVQRVSNVSGLQRGTFFAEVVGEQRHKQQHQLTVNAQGGGLAE